MKQQTIDLDISPSDETISEDLNEAAWNSPKETSMGCRNTGIHHVGLRAKNPAASAEFYRDVLGMEIVGGEHPRPSNWCDCLFDEPSR